MAATLHKDLYYKTVGAEQLEIRIWEPDATQFPGPRPGMIFFPGGGFYTANLFQLYQQALHFANLGITTACATYRVSGSAGWSTPLDSVVDVQDAFEWFRWQTVVDIDEEQVGVCGASAGGLGALWCGDADIVCLFNPILSMSSAEGYGNTLIGDYWKILSPIESLHPRVSTLILQGGSDTTALPVLALDYMYYAPDKVKVKLYEGQEHSFFNYKMVGMEDGENPYYHSTLAEMELFLRYHGWVE